MPDYLFQNEDLDIFGGPTSLDVSLDFGRTGERGTRTWVGNGDASAVLASQDVNLYDLYIDSGSSDGWLYQYIPEIGGPEWAQVLRLNQQQDSRITSKTFTTGQTTLSIPTSEITTDTTLTAGQFIIRYNIENDYPTASSFTYSIATVSSVKYIQIIIKAAEWDGTTWANLSGPHNVHTFISYESTLQEEES
jgi:hypothetical protein